MNKILILANSDVGLYLFRRELIYDFWMDLSIRGNQCEYYF